MFKPGWPTLENEDGFIIQLLKTLFSSFFFLQRVFCLGGSLEINDLLLISKETNLDNEEST